jgi:oxygen-independent coproporphyrinogen-3 oxidase
MGAQSFDAGLLRWMGRIHSPEDVETAFRAARAAGFANVNLDFMYALPGQALATWAATLERAIALAPDHLSLYSLIVEEHTPLHRWVGQGKVQLADEDTAAEMYELAAARLAAAGYEQYEISNWARGGAECRHNLTYWHNLPYIGLGAGAHSWYAGHRFVEARSIREYTTRVGAATQPEAGSFPTTDSAPTALPAAAIGEDEAIAGDLEMAETAMLRLRLTAGLPLGEFAARYGRPFADVFGDRLADVTRHGLIEMTPDVVRLTPRGRLLGNEVFARLLPDAAS